MTSRERWLAAAKLQPVDRLPFWPKLNRSYAIHQEGRFRSMTANEIHEWMGSDRPVQIGQSCVREVRTHSSIEVTGNNGEQRTVFRTKNGSMDMVMGWDEASQSRHPVVFPIKTREDKGSASQRMIPSGMPARMVPAPRAAMPGMMTCFWVGVPG